MSMAWLSRSCRRAIASDSASMKSKCHRSIWLITPSRLTKVELTIFPMTQSFSLLTGEVIAVGGQTSSRDDVEGQGQRDDQRADAEVDRFVAEEYGGEFAEHGARPVVARGPRPG